MVETQSRGRRKGGSGMIDASTLAPLRALAGRVLELCDIDAACVLMIAQGKTPTETAAELSRICAPGGEADRLADVLEKNPQAAKDYAARLAATFAPFAEIVRSMTPGGDVRYFRFFYSYRKTTIAGFKEAEANREAKQKRLEARFVVSYAEAAARIGVTVAVAHDYAYRGKLVAVYPNGKKKAEGVTRASLEAYIERREMRRAAAMAKAEAKAESRAERKRMGGIFYAESGERIGGEDRITVAEAATLYGLNEKRLHNAAKSGKVAKVYVDTAHRHAVGYLRATVESYAAEREIVAAAGGTYYTAVGKIVEAERISRREAAQLFGLRESSVTAICRRGEIAHVYADPSCTIPCGYTRASVEAWAQAHPRHIPARKAQAIPDFMIAPLPPPPRNHGLRAARLDPDATGEAAGEKPAAVIEGEATRPQRRRKPTVVFMLAAWNAATTSEEKERNMENETNEKPAEAAKPTAPGKLEIAKAYTVHEAGVIRAICVSEADRDEIVEALRLYRRARAKPGEVESALQLLRAAREIVGTTPPAEPEAPDATPAAAATN